jgi:transposase-like protein
MKIELPDKTIRDVEAVVARDGGDIIEFIDRAVNRSLLFDTVRQIREHNANVDPEELQAAIDEAIEAVRAERRMESQTGG